MNQTEIFVINAMVMVTLLLFCSRSNSIVDMVDVFFLFYERQPEVKKCSVVLILHYVLYTEAAEAASAATCRHHVVTETTFTRHSSQCPTKTHQS